VSPGTLGKSAVSVTRRCNDCFSLSSALWHSANLFAECPRKNIGKEGFADVLFTEPSLSSVTLGKAFAECFLGFAECFRHSAKPANPVVCFEGICCYRGVCFVVSSGRIGQDQRRRRSDRCRQQNRVAPWTPTPGTRTRRREVLSFPTGAGDKNRRRRHTGLGFCPARVG
jgi:hypothetical protein